jgi:hypothetical protein
MRVFGIHNLAGHGPVILVTNAANAQQQINVRWASDREVHYFQSQERELGIAVEHLDKGDVIGLSVNQTTTGSDLFLDVLRKKYAALGVLVIPVHVSHADVKFGHPIVLENNIESMRQAIEATAEGEED